MVFLFIGKEGIIVKNNFIKKKINAVKNLKKINIIYRNISIKFYVEEGVYA
jgi:hypothetical protein